MLNLRRNKNLQLFSIKFDFLNIKEVSLLFSEVPIMHIETEKKEKKSIQTYKHVCTLYIHCARLPQNRKGTYIGKVYTYKGGENLMVFCKDVTSLQSTLSLVLFKSNKDVNLERK